MRNTILGTGPNPLSLTVRRKVGLFSGQRTSLHSLPGGGIPRLPPRKSPRITLLFRVVSCWLWLEWTRGMKKGKKSDNKRKRDKYEETDDWCFVCKDGGDLMICDHEDCLKVYHPECVGKDTDLLQNEKSWTCDRHSCFVCSKATKMYCYCCPNAICGTCDSSAEFAPCCRNGGLCYECFKLVILAEENADCDSDGEKLDFDDRETYECLLKEYWDIIKEKEGLTIDHVYSAESFFRERKLSKRRSSSIKNDAVEEGYQLISDSDEDGLPKKKANKAKKSGASEFQGSVSKVLARFLNSIGEDASKEISLLEVHQMICEYIHKENLHHPKKKNKFLCDEKLFSIFRRKVLHRNRIYKLLQPHFINASELSDDTESDDAHEVKTIDRSKGSSIRQCLQVKSTGAKTKKPVEEVAVTPKVRKTGYASLDINNMKLIYVRKSLVEELAKQRDTFEGKMIGSLIKVKVDPLDVLQTRRYQLVQVTGVRRIPADDDSSSQILLQVSGRSTDVSMGLLSDADIYEEDCEDLRERANAGLFKKLTLVDVQEKATVLHEERTEHWIKKELVRLEYLVEQANEKGWRREYPFYLEQRSLLRKPTEVERLLKQQPKVIPETVVEASSNSEIDDEPVSDSPPVILVDG
ncbi:hypothetical protein MLD38_023856 [Melastoma candidum]|uniref:Uncharacterized protein n=1 Tax=Melastoma candidum TaxID=119954 RepID=A0ACB9NQD4_9MYRT|nr:hypothetical protein MLD38_023856 [Melastoma candidum]